MRILILLLALLVIVSCAPGQIKKYTAPGQVKKYTGYNPASGKIK
jgi:hypothetical protein